MYCVRKTTENQVKKLCYLAYPDEIWITGKLNASLYEHTYKLEIFQSQLQLKFNL